MTNSFFVRQNTCPACNYTMDSAGSMDGSPIIPEPNDVAVCINCGEILQFDKHMRLHKISDAELNKIESVELETYFDLIKGQGLARAMKKARGDRNENL